MSVANPATTYTDRVERLRAALRAQNLDAILVTNPENRRYLSGFTGHDSGADSAGALVITGDAVTLITDGRYTEQAATECPGLRVVKRDGQFAPAAAAVIAEAGIGRLGFEATHVTVAQHDDLKDRKSTRLNSSHPSI